MKSRHSLLPRLIGCAHESVQYEAHITQEMFSRHGEDLEPMTES